MNSDSKMDTSGSTNPSSGSDESKGGSSGAVGFGLFGSGTSTAKQEPEQPGMLQQFADKLIGTLSKMVEDATTLEVKTYTSNELTAAEAAGRAPRTRLRAYSRISLGGDTEICVPETDGQVDNELWALHVEMVKAAQAQRSEMIKLALSSVSGLLNLK